MNEIKVIDQRRVLEQDFYMYGTFDEPLFLAQDIAKWIEYDMSSINKMLANVDENEKVRNIVPTLGGNQEAWLLTENGLYEVLFQSRKPIAKQFKSEVKKILHEVRTGKVKIVPMTEYQQMMAKTRAENVRIRKARELLRLAEKYKAQTFAQVLDSYATHELTGERLIPLPELKGRTYSATEIGQRIGLSANMVGMLANRHNLKVEGNGVWCNDKAKGHNKEVPVFRYYENMMPVFEGFAEATKPEKN